MKNWFKKQAKAFREWVFRLRLKDDGFRFKDPQGDRVHQFIDHNGGIWLGRSRWDERLRFFSYEDINKLPRQQRRRALSKINKQIKRMR